MTSAETGSWARDKKALLGSTYRLAQAGLDDLLPGARMGEGEVEEARWLWGRPAGAGTSLLEGCGGKRLGAPGGHIARARPRGPRRRLQAGEMSSGHGQCLVGRRRQGEGAQSCSGGVAQRGLRPGNAAFERGPIGGPTGGARGAACQCQAHPRPHVQRRIGVFCNAGRTILPPRTNYAPGHDGRIGGVLQWGARRGAGGPRKEPGLHRQAATAPRVRW